MNLTGSRFSLLENQEEIDAGMVDRDDGGPKGEEIGANLAVVITSHKDKGKGVSIDEGSISDDVNLRASHLNLATKIMPLPTDGSTASPKIDLSMGSSKKVRDVALKEITNRLDFMPIKLKPNWSGQRLGGLILRKGNRGYEKDGPRTGAYQ